MGVRLLSRTARVRRSRKPERFTCALAVMASHEVRFEQVTFESRVRKIGIGCDAILTQTWSSRNDACVVSGIAKGVSICNDPGYARGAFRGDDHRYIHTTPGAKYIPEQELPASHPLARSWDITYRIFCEGAWKTARVEANLGNVVR